MKKTTIVLIISLFLIVLGSIFFQKTNDIKINNSSIYGMGIVNSGDMLFVSTHEGLITFKKSNWERVSDQSIIFKNFIMSEEGFYAVAFSNGSNNSLGIVYGSNNGDLIPIHSNDNSHIHLLSVGYLYDVIYVLNNSISSNPSLDYSKDKGNTWIKSNSNGLPDIKINSISVLETDASLVAVGTEKGVYLSSDYGDNFKLIPLTDEVNVTSLYYGDKDYIFIGGNLKNRKNELIKVNLNKNSLEGILLPNNDSPILHITGSIKNEDILVIATLNNDIYMTENKAQNWLQIMSKGKVTNIKYN